MKKYNVVDTKICEQFKNLHLVNHDHVTIEEGSEFIFKGKMIPKKRFEND